MALAALPGLVGEPGLAANRDIFVAVGELGHHGTGDAGIGLRHQPLQFGGAGGEVLALGLQLLAIVEIVFGGIGERLGHAVVHVGAAGKAKAEHGQRQNTGGPQWRPGTQWRPGKGYAGDHLTFVNLKSLRERKTAADVRIEALL